MSVRCHEGTNSNLAAVGANARGRNAAFPSLHPVLADQCMSPQGCLPTMRVRLRGRSRAQDFAPTRVGMDDAGVGVTSRYQPAMHMLLRARRSDRLLKKLIAVVWMHRNVAIAVSLPCGRGRRAYVQHRKAAVDQSAVTP